MKHRALFALLVASAGLSYSGCGDHNKAQNIAVTFSQAPPASIAANATATVAATVTNDPAAAGADWDCMPAGACGSFNPTHTASGATTTYTAPPSANAGNVTITAKSTTDPSASASATVTVTALTVTLTQPPPSSLLVSSTASIIATVNGDPSATPSVTWNCTPASLCSSSSFSPSTTASGAATVFTAPPTAGTVTVTAASVTDPTVTASASINIVVPQNFSFSAIGLQANVDAFITYALAGSVLIDPATGDVLAGEQDYNDGFAITSPQPQGDAITGGSLTTDSTGQGTLTLITNNPAVGVNGTETLGVQFVNPNHALVIQFDGSATSSGSMDLQTLSGMPSGSFSFNFSGVSTSGFSTAAGGVFTINGTDLQNGVADIDEAGNITLGSAFTAVISAPDSFGRGTITNFPITLTLNYYVIGPEALRIIAVDPTVTGAGSAFGQGSSAGTFGPGSLGSSVFGVESNSDGFLYAAAGMLSTTPSTGAFQGVADVDEEGAFTNAAPISGTFSVGNNGRGNVSITSGALQDVSFLGIYLVDPTLNISDPNNTTSGLGGALVADLDVGVVGTGVLIPQTDTATASFTGNYAFGAQVFNPAGEVDFLGQGTVTSGALSGTGLLNDPFLTLTTNAESSITASGTAQPDLANPGRYAMPTTSPLTLSINGSAPFAFTTVIYQASGAQLIWVETDSESLFGGTLQQADPPAAAVKTASKKKPKP